MQRTLIRATLLVLAATWLLPAAHAAPKPFSTQNQLTDRITAHAAPQSTPTQAQPTYPLTAHAAPPTTAQVRPTDRFTAHAVPPPTTTQAQPTDRVTANAALQRTTAQAQPADSFVDTICVATHWRYTDRAYYMRYEDVRQKLLNSGIRHVRDDLYQQRPQELGQRGISSTVLVDVPNYSRTTLVDGNEQMIAAAIADIKAANAAGAKIEAVEGPNEPDFFWDLFPRTYKGQGFPQGVIAFQRDLYRAIKSDPATKHITVIGPSLGKTYDPGGGFPNPLANGVLTDAVDWGNFHPYPGGNPFNDPTNSAYGTIERYYWQSNFPSVNIDKHPFTFEVYGPPFAPKPMAATETGYSTYNTWVSEKVHGKYIPRLFLEYFRKGIKRTCSYEFIDQVDDRSDREANFGLLRYDLSPKPAYTAIKNLITLLNDAGPTFTPSSLTYSIDVKPVLNYTEPLSGRVTNYDRTEYVHHVLLQKRDGTFYLVLWHEVSNNDTSASPPREIQPPAMPTTITLGTAISSATLYRWDDAGNMSASAQPITGNTISLSVPDKVTVLKLTPANAVVPTQTARKFLPLTRR